MNGNRLSRRQFLRGVALVASGALVSACAPQVVEKTVEVPVEQTVVVKEEVEVPVAQTVVVKETVEVAVTEPELAGTVRLYTTHGAELMPFMEKSMEKFNAMFPGITVEWDDVVGLEYYDKLNTMMAGGTMPDVFLMRTCDPFDWYYKGALLDLAPLLDSDPDLSTDDYIKVIMDVYLIEGKVTGLPYDASAEFLFYNKDMFDEAEVAYPDETWDWDTLLAVCPSLMKEEGGTVEQFALAEMPFLATWQSEVLYRQNGARMLSDDRTECLLGSDEAIEALQFFSDLRLVYNYAPTAEQGSSWDLFTLGRAATWMAGQWMIPGFRANLKFNWDIALLWGGPEGRGTISHGGGYSIFSGTKVADLAYQMTKWICTGDWQRTVYGFAGYSVPAYKAESDAFVQLTSAPHNLPPANARVVLDEIAVADPPDIWPNWWKCDQVWAGIAEEVGLGETTAEEAAPRIVDELNAIIDEFWAENLQA